MAEEKRVRKIKKKFIVADKAARGVKSVGKQVGSFVGGFASSFLLNRVAKNDSDNDIDLKDN